MAGNPQRKRGLLFALGGTLLAATLIAVQPDDDGTTLRYSVDPAARGAVLEGQAADSLAFGAVLSASKGLLVDFDAGLERTKRRANERLAKGAVERVASDRMLAEAEAEAEAAAAASTTANSEQAVTPSTSAAPATDASAATETRLPESGTLLPIVPSLPSDTRPATTDTSAPPSSTAKPSTIATAPETSAAPATTTSAEPPATTAAPLVASKTPISVPGSLTGLRSGPNRPALAIKIDNSAAARPQSGINQADVVMEELVEFGLTRLIAIFHSTDPATVGPVRSARTSDIHLLSNMNQPLLGYSGANAGVLKQLDASALTLAGAPNNAAGYSRSSSRKAPHNLFASPAKLRSRSGSAGNAPAMFAYRPAGSAAINGAQSVSGTSIEFGTDTVAYTWNGLGWVRTIGGRPHTDSTGKVVAPENVVVRFTEYRQSVIDARSPEAVAVGSGVAWVLTDGKLIKGTWSQASPTAPTTYADASGDPILLTPGRTWVALPRPGTASTF